MTVVSAHRRQLLAIGLGSSLAWAAPQARACEYFTKTLRVTHPWTRATAADAEFAVVNMKFDEVMQADRLIAVETPVASSAEMGGAAAGEAVDFAIPFGETSTLGEAVSTSACAACSTRCRSAAATR